MQRPARGGAGAEGPPRSGYRYRGDVAIADLAFEAWGGTLEELLVAAADATTNAMVEDLGTIEPREHRAIRLEQDSADLLLLALLQELLFYKDAEGLLLRVREARVSRRDGRLTLAAKARGEPLDPARHRLLADVKAVTLHRLRVEPTARGWEGSVVLDV